MKKAGRVHKRQLTRRNKRKVSVRRVRKVILPKLTQHPEPEVSVIVPVMNERRTLPYVLAEAAKLSAAEVIVVANGCTDGSAELAAEAGAVVLSIPSSLGHDVGRAVGAQAARGSILLFVDADFVIRSKELNRYIEAVRGGVDVALNRYSGPVRTRRPHGVVVAKHVLNTMLHRSDLRGASLTAVPHALSRRALETIGAEALAVPPLAHAMAIWRGLRTEAVHPVEVGKSNQRRSAHVRSAVEKLIIGDHLEAVRWLTQQTNIRGGFSDLWRNRAHSEVGG